VFCADFFGFVEEIIWPLTSKCSEKMLKIKKVVAILWKNRFHSQALTLGIIASDNVKMHYSSILKCAIFCYTLYFIIINLQWPSCYDGSSEIVTSQCWRRSGTTCCKRCSTWLCRCSGRGCREAAGVHTGRKEATLSTFQGHQLNQKRNHSHSYCSLLKSIIS